jgi:hypothetical protein
MCCFEFVVYLTALTVRVYSIKLLNKERWIEGDIKQNSCGIICYYAGISYDINLYCS